MFLCRFSWLCEPLFRIPRNLGTRNAYGGCRSPPYAVVFLQVSLILFQAVAACVTKCLFCHIRRRLARRPMANAATHKAAAAVLWAGGSLRSSSRCGGSGGTISPPFCRSAPLRPLHPCRRHCGRLNKTCILSPSSRRFSPRLRRWVARSARSVPPAAAHSRRLRRLRNNRPSLRVAVQTTRPQGHIIVSRTCHCGSKVAAHGRYCKFCDTVSLHRFFVHCAALSARRAVF